MLGGGSLKSITSDNSYEVGLRVLSGVFKRNRLLAIIDAKAETVPLFAAKHAAKCEVHKFMAKLMCEEEIKWAQRANIRHVLKVKTMRILFI